MKKISKKNILAIFGILAIISIIGILKGSADIPLKEIFAKENQVIFNLRFFRIITAIVVGCGLSVSGIVLQAILRNPLADPYLLGTSSGAGVGAVLAIILGFSRAYLPLAAFLGAVLTIYLVYIISKQGNKIPEQSLILSGVIVSVALSAIIVFLVSASGNEALHEITWWLWGNLQIYDLKLLLYASIIVLTGATLISLYSRELNAVSTGEEEAVHLGINIERLKKILLGITCIITASLVCICGIIGFVGLMIPHMARLIFGPNHRVLIPVSCLLASIFMVFSDMLSRVIISPLEVPIGVITAILGAPVFIILLKKKRI